MLYQGRCHCGDIRYEVNGEPEHVALCHCSDCRHCAGAPMVSWAAFAETALTVTQGTPLIYNAAGTAERSFCGRCGTGLFYRNPEFLPGLVDIQSVTLDDASALPPGVHIQTAERLPWMADAHNLPGVERYPG